MEPAIQQLETAVRTGKTPDQVPAFRNYVAVCRWPFRRLEYELALRIMRRELPRNGRFLDAGSGVTPLAHVIAGQGAEAHACDVDAGAIQALQRLDTDALYGSHVCYTWQDLTRTSYDDASFDAVSCISVIEHLPAPLDQRVVRELVRILKPGGALILTVDFAPPSAGGTHSSLRRYARRAANLARRGDISGIVRGMRTKLRARQAARGGAAHQPRSAHQCFEVEHLRQDVLPLLAEHTELEYPEFAVPPQHVTPADARHFWELDEGLFELQGRRLVLPLAIVVRKAGGATVAASA
jgi:SAM-dependent methyltransferase